MLKKRYGSHPILRDGLVAGLIGAVSVAVWFLLVDIVAGKPLFTPAVIGSAVFSGLRDPAELVVSMQPVLLYSVVHVLAFSIVGIIASTMMAEAERDPHLSWLLVEFFVVLEFGFYAVVALLFTPLLAALAWANVAVGNLIAAVTMGYYLWRVRPGLRRALLEQLMGHDAPDTTDSRGE
jgi:hypothetical protein